MPTKKVNWSKTSRKQYLAAIEYILNDSVQNAEKAEGKIKDKLKIIAEFAESCPPDKYKVNNDGSYRVSYRIKRNEILILRVRHESMKPKYY